MPLKQNELFELRRQMNKTTKYSEGIREGIELAASFESCSLKPYAATKKEAARGIYTIGVGMTRFPDDSPVQKDSPELSLVSAMELFLEMIDARISFIKGCLTKEALANTSEYQMGALISFCYQAGYGNLKKSKLLAFHNNQCFHEAADEFTSRTWTTQGGEELGGLVRRRKAEYELYVKG